MTFTITESERREILGLYGIVHNEPTPLQKLRECKYTTDGKFVIFEGIGYSCETGEQIPINEAWTTSDTLHTIADLASAGLDFVFPGSGAVIDTLNAISYIIEAHYTQDAKDKLGLYTMATITFAFVFIPGWLQTTITPLKVFVKTGKGAGTPLVKMGLEIVAKSIDKIILGIPRMVSKVLKSPLADKILGKFGSKFIAGLLDIFTKTIKDSLDLILGTGVKATTKTTVKGVSRLAEKVKSLKIFFKHPIDATRGAYIMKKFGFGVGKEYGYVVKSGKFGERIKILNVTGDTIIVQNVTGGKPYGMYLNRFLEGTVGAPWAHKAYSESVPFFIKTFARSLLPDGSGLNYEELDKIPDMNPEETSQESLSYVSGGDETNVTQSDQTTNDVQGSELYQLIQPNPSSVMAFQNALMGLGYNLPQYGVNGKFGSETQGVLSRFQSDYSLESSSGKMDRLTAKTLATALKNKNVQDSQSLQKTLYSM